MPVDIAYSGLGVTDSDLPVRSHSILSNHIPKLLVLLLVHFDFSHFGIALLWSGKILYS